jgi:hypothetical protein
VTIEFDYSLDEKTAQQADCQFTYETRKLFQVTGQSTACEIDINNV